MKAAEADCEAWRSGEPSELWRHHVTLPVMLRLKDIETVETSKHAEFPIEHARKAWKLIRLAQITAEAWERNGSTIRVGHFQIDSIDIHGNVVAGCHKITFAEMARFATSRGW